MGNRVVLPRAAHDEGLDNRLVEAPGIEPPRIPGKEIYRITPHHPPCDGAPCENG